MDGSTGGRGSTDRRASTGRRPVARLAASLAPRHRLRGLADRLSPYVTAALVGLLDDRLLSRETVRQVAAIEGAVYEYGSAESFALDPPESPANPEGMVARRVGQHSLPRPFVCELPDCTLAGAYPVALTDRGEVVLEAVVREGVLLRNVAGSLAHLLANPGRARTFRRDEQFDAACLLFNYWSGGYFHWVFESLVRLEGVERYRERTGRSPVLVLGPDPPSWQRESLELLGYGPDEWVAWDCQRASVDRLVVPTVRREAVLSPGAVRWLRERVHERLADDASPDPGDFPDRVYVSRADATRRRVRNEAAAVDALADRGFVRVVPSELDVPEQAALFAGADVVVAPHGAGLTNLAYAGDPVVVELFRDGDVRGQYYQLAKVLDLEYHYLVGESTGPDLAVDVDELVDVLAGAGIDVPASAR